MTGALFLTVAHKYTREAGVRNFERKLGAVMRAVALKFAEKHNDTSDVLDLKLSKKSVDDWPIVIDEMALSDILGVRDCIRLSFLAGISSRHSFSLRYTLTKLAKSF